MTKAISNPAPPPPRPPHRPSDYKPEYADLMLAHFQQPAWDCAINGKAVEGFFPTLAGFCVQIGTTQRTLWAWANAVNEDGSAKYPEFLLAYELAKEYQEQYFTQGYMSGKYTNPAIGALIAKNLLNWKDKQEVDQTTVATVTSTVNQRVEMDFTDIVAQAKDGAA